LPCEQPGHDEAYLDFTDPARAKAPDLRQAALLVKLYNITNGAGRLGRGHVCPAQRFERLG